MRIEELEVGDIVVDIKHSGIYVGVKDGKHCIVHALSSGYHGANVRCTSFDTFFKACNTGNIQVFRAKNKVLANNAAAYAYKFGLNKDLLFDELRLIQANSFSDKIEQAQKTHGVNGLDILHETFMISGLFRAIKFASRRDLNLLKKNDNNHSTRGLRCAFFVCLCYQISALTDLVEALPKESKLWVSNKHIDKNLLLLRPNTAECKGYHSYLNYISKPKLDIIEGKLIQKEIVQPLPASTAIIKNPNSKLKRITPEINSEPSLYQPAIFQWRGKEDLDDRKSILQLANRMTTAMMVDAKYCTARDLTELLANDKTSWMLIGYLHHPSDLENQLVQTENILPKMKFTTP